MAQTFDLISNINTNPPNPREGSFIHDTWDIEALENRLRKKAEKREAKRAKKNPSSNSSPSQQLTPAEKSKRNTVISLIGMAGLSVVAPGAALYVANKGLNELGKLLSAEKSGSTDTPLSTEYLPKELDDLPHYPIQMGVLFEGKTTPEEPSITAERIDEILRYYNSPALQETSLSDRADGKAFYELGIKYGIDPIVALAFFMHESGLGTTGVIAKQNKSVGNMRDNTPGGFQKFRTWREGLEAFYIQLRNYYNGAIERDVLGDKTIRSLNCFENIIHTWAPSGDPYDTTHVNDEVGYIAHLREAVRVWKNGGIQVSAPEELSHWKRKSSFDGKIYTIVPQVYDKENKYLMYKTTLS